MSDRQRTRTRSSTRTAHPILRSRTTSAGLTGSGSPSHSDAHLVGQSTTDLTNARTRIVGNRTGAIADLVVAGVRFARAVRAPIARVAAATAAVVTPLGWVILVAAVVGLIVGYGIGWVELTAAGFACVFLVVFAVCYLVGRTQFALQLELEHPRVTVGSPASATVIVDNPTKHRIAGGAVEVPVGDRMISLSVPPLPAGGVDRQDFAIPTERRGVYAVGPARTVRADPIGMVRREVVLSGERELFVHPATVVIPSTSTGLIRDLEGKPTRDLSNSDVAFHALREYSPGDDRRYIHWKSTAKTGTYMVRQFEETRRSRLVVALSLALDDYATDAEFEMAVSAAASLGLRAIRDARDVSVVVGEKTPEFAKRKLLRIRQLDSVNGKRLLDGLAGVELAESSLSTLDVARVAAEKVTGISVAFLVCGSTVTPTALRAASIQFPVGVEVVAVVCDPESVPGLRQVVGLSVLTIGYLHDLQASLARTAAA